VTSLPGTIPPKYPIHLPEGFGISVFAEGLIGPSMMDIGPDNMIYISEPSTGRILRLPDRDGDGVADEIEVAAEGLIEPSGLAFYNDGSLYVAETTRVLRLLDPDGDGFFQDRETITAGFAASGHTSRSIIFSPDWRHFYLSIGSSCNVCEERDQRRASVMRFTADGSSEKMFTQGLRHVVGMDFNPGNDILWVANDERHGLGDDLPPETIYAIYIDASAGWPACHAGRIIDPEFGEKNSCEDLLSPIFELEAHTSPYGIVFYMGDQFPDDYKQDLFVALHGSNDGSNPAGYKILRIPFGGGERGPVEDFAVGWLLDDGTIWGAPVDLITGPDGSLYISDDDLGVVYRIFYND
jgi:glucose/arabinose dehydrogenase